MTKHLLRILILLCIFSFSDLVQANNSDPSGSFSVTPVLSENQTSDVDGFFDIKWRPSDVETIGIRISNKTDEPKSYEILVTKAETNVNQIIDYSNKKDSLLSSRFKIKQQVNFPKTVSLKANESKVVEGKVIFPDDDFNGILMGGINVSESIDNVPENSGISNIIVYNIPIVLRGNIEERPAPKIDFGRLTLDESLTDEMVLNLRVKNLGPNLLNKVSFDSKIVNSNKEVIEEQQVVFDITPETEFDFQLPLKQDYKPGQYTLDLVMSHKSGDTWEYSQSFSLSEEDSERIKEQTEVKDEKNKHWAIVIIFVIIMLLITCWLFYKKHERREE